eukprot:TRINITY_DN13319_c2_g1_i4.p1 TRINITY_DN13319_c2_g1~~TRINITY_DN13319_c2_g1_i4.p1  ORF type:complete len:207 (+),score=14.10 TRINITY_DN13319_c2_g1_i4:500-1120(+)
MQSLFLSLSLSLYLSLYLSLCKCPFFPVPLLSIFPLLAGLRYICAPPRSPPPTFLSHSIRLLDGKFSVVPDLRRSSAVSHHDGLLKSGREGKKRKGKSFASSSPFFSRVRKGQQTQTAHRLPAPPSSFPPRLPLSLSLSLSLSPLLPPKFNLECVRNIILSIARVLQHVKVKRQVNQPCASTYGLLFPVFKKRTVRTKYSLNSTPW